MAYDCQASVAFGRLISDAGESDPRADEEDQMKRGTMLTTAAVACALALSGTLWATHTLAKTKGGCSDTQVCCRYSKDGMTALDCMDAKACKDAGGTEVANKSMCAE
jgi:hypothetical protein